jgi:hypothetical protein
LRGKAPTRFFGSFFAARQKMNSLVLNSGRAPEGRSGRVKRRSRLKFKLLPLNFSNFFHFLIDKRKNLW